MDDSQKEKLKGLLGNITRTEKLILALYYYEEMTFKEIGAVLNLSESRAIQIHSSVISHLKSKLNQ